VALHPRPQAQARAAHELGPGDEDGGPSVTDLYSVTSAPGNEEDPGDEVAFFCKNFRWGVANLVSRACDPRVLASSVLARIPGFRQRIIPEPHVPSRGSQARGTRFGCCAIVLFCALILRIT
jgi:hypothetical protein